MKEPNVNPTISTIPKASTNASFIKEDVKQIWLDQVYMTKNANPYLKLALLLPDAHIKEAKLNEVKSYFATWDDNVMIFLYTVMFQEEEDKTAQSEEIPLTYIDNDMLEMQAEKIKMIAEMKKYKEDMEKVKAEMEATRAKVNARINRGHKELAVIIDLVERSRRESRTATALSSRATSPKGRQGAGTLLESTSIRLKGLAHERN